MLAVLGYVFAVLMGAFWLAIGFEFTRLEARCAEIAEQFAIENTR
ncbi:hypothetical protein [Dactylosporangium sp. CA-139066]